MYVLCFVDLLSIFFHSQQKCSHAIPKRSQQLFIKLTVLLLFFFLWFLSLFLFFIILICVCFEDSKGSVMTYSDTRYRRKSIFLSLHFGSKVELLLCINNSRKFIFSIEWHPLVYLYALSLPAEKSFANEHQFSSSKCDVHTSGIL